MDSYGYSRIVLGSLPLYSVAVDLERAYSLALVYGVYHFYRLPCFPRTKGNAEGKLYAVVRYRAYGAW